LSSWQSEALGLISTRSKITVVNRRYEFGGSSSSQRALRGSNAAENLTYALSDCRLDDSQGVWLCRLGGSHQVERLLSRICHCRVHAAMTEQGGDASDILSLEQRRGCERMP
jgi:hypothetical protein